MLSHNMILSTSYSKYLRAICPGAVVGEVIICVHLSIMVIMLCFLSQIFRSTLILVTVWTIGPRIKPEPKFEPKTVNIKFASIHII